MTRPAPRPPVAMRVIVLAVLLVAFALRLTELTRQNIWWDEARNIDVALRPLAQIATAPELDIQPPFYYWLLHFWTQLTGVTPAGGPAQLAYLARWMSVAAGLLATALLYPLAVRIFSPQAGLFALTVAALSPFWLAESQEARMYTISFALLSGAALALVKGIQGIEEIGAIGDARVLSPITKIASIAQFAPFLFFILLSALAVLTHYNALFILVAWYGWWGMWALVVPVRWRQGRALLICGLATVLLLLPLLPLALRQIPTYANPNLTVPTVIEYLIQNWRAYLGGYAYDPAMLNGYAPLWLWGTFVITLVAFFYGVYVQRTFNPATRHSPLATFPLFWAIGGLALYYIAVLDRGAFNVRYSSLITPALYLLIGAALAAVGRWWRPLSWVMLVGLVVGLAPALHADLYDPRFAREDIGGVTDWLRATAGPRDLILVDQKYPFGFYYQRYVIDPQQTPQGVEPAPARYLFVDINTLDRQLNEWAGQAERVFWVQWYESDTDPRHAVHFLLDKYGRRAGSQSFQGYSIDWWTLDPPTHFVLAPDLRPLHYRFGPVVETVEASLPASLKEPGAGLPVVIRWRRMAGAPAALAEQHLKARVALYDALDTRLAQSDERLLNDRHLMPNEWAMEDMPLNVYFLPLPDQLPARDYMVRLLVYYAETLEPLSLLDAAGNPAGVEADLGTISIVSQ
jgi:mannosyltransferase